MSPSLNQPFSSQGLRLRVIGYKLSLLSGIATIAVISSCASDPTPEVVHPIPAPVSIPTPPLENEDVAPDPIDMSVISDTGDTSATVNFPNPGVIKTAKPVPGRPGYVFNPYTQNMVDVSGIPSGTKVKDPHDKDETHIFKVP